MYGIDLRAVYAGRFISEGYFEKHINRMRLHYGRKRQSVLSSIKGCFTKRNAG